MAPELRRKSPGAPGYQFALFLTAPNPAFENHYLLPPQRATLTIPTNITLLPIYAMNCTPSIVRGCGAGCIQVWGGGGHRTWIPVTKSPFWLTEENWALGRLNRLQVCVPCPETLGRRHYTFSSLLMFRVEVLQVIEGMGSPEASQVRVTCSSSSMAVWFST